MPNITPITPITGETITSITSITAITGETINTTVNTTSPPPPSSFLGYSSLPLVIDSPFQQPESLRPLVFSIVMLLYSLTVAGNSLLCWVIYRDARLHRPMFILVANLSLNALVGSSATLPRVMRDLLGRGTISPGECVAQVYFIHTYMSLEYYILASMSADRYLAVCQPLRYHSLMTNGRAAWLNAGVHAATAVWISVVVWLVLRLDLCRSRVIDNLFCNHMALVKLACNDTTLNNVVGLTVTVMTMGVGMAVIAASYASILSQCYRARRSGQSKAVGTCVTHLGSLGVFALCSLMVLVLPRVERLVKLSSQTRAVVNVSVIVMPPLLNPVIYGLRTAEIRAWLRGALSRKRVSPQP